MTKESFDDIEDLVKRQIQIAEDALYRATVDAKRMPTDEFSANCVRKYQAQAQKWRDNLAGLYAACG